MHHGVHAVDGFNRSDGRIEGETRCEEHLPIDSMVATKFERLQQFPRSGCHARGVGKHAIMLCEKCERLSEERRAESANHHRKSRECACDLIEKVRARVLESRGGGCWPRPTEEDRKLVCLRSIEDLHSSGIRWMKSLQ